jgi:(5-formylfuran-3-yl)methyl phosphate synthase
MTQMLASVRDPEEAEIALVEGADIIDLKDPSEDALGAVDLSVVKATLEKVAGRRRVSAVCGNMPTTARLAEAAASLASAGVDFVKLGLVPNDRLADDIEALRHLAACTKLVAVCFADLGLDLAWLPKLAKAGFAGAMIDTATKSRLRLIDHMNVSELDRFAAACRHNRLMVGMAGGLEAPDVARLLLLDPDILGFRSALCADKNRAGRVVGGNVKLIRDLIPRADVPHKLGEDLKVDWRFLAARGYSANDEARPATDRVFVHDLVLPVSIGAYEFERNTTQKVRFAIDVDVRRGTRQAEDMRDVFSYDVIIDAVRLILSRGHIALVETLAEQIADALLAHPRALGVNVRVEKLDVIDGCVGVAIERRRPSAAAQRNVALHADISAIKTSV